MGQTVYVDLYFLINFSMDFLCLFLTAKLLNHTLSPLRGILAGTVGGVYANLALFLPWGWLGGLLADLAVGGVMCVITFGKRGRWHSMPLYILVFGAVSMALGGVMTALFHLLNRVPLPEEAESAEGDGISVWVFAVLALISGGITLFGGRFFAGRATEETAEIELCYEGQTVRLCAMTDSGNLLREPISGKPCIVADLDAVSAILPEEILRAARLGAERGMATLTGGAGRRVRLIPTKTAAGESFLLGVRMERITVYGKKGAHEVEAMVALSELGQGAAGSRALLPTGLMIS